MNLFSCWQFYIALYLIFTVSFNHTYKIATQKMKKASSFAALVQYIGAIFSLCFLIFFPFSFPKKISVFFFLGLASIFYALHAKLSTIARCFLDVSYYGMIKQLSTVFMIVMGFFFFKEPLIWTHFIGIVFIIFGNLFVFYSRGKIQNHTYIKLGVLANLCMGIALFLDVNYSNQFNLAFYVAFILFIPACIICLFEKIKRIEIIEEYNHGNKKMILLSAFSWAMMMILKLKAYQLGPVTMVAPFCSLSVLLNVIIGYLFLKERNHLFRKLVASLLIVIGIFFIYIN